MALRILQFRDWIRWAVISGRHDRARRLTAAQNRLIEWQKREAPGGPPGAR